MAYSSSDCEPRPQPAIMVVCGPGTAQTTTIGGSDVAQTVTFSWQSVSNGKSTSAYMPDSSIWRAVIDGPGPRGSVKMRSPFDIVPTADVRDVRTAIKFDQYDTRRDHAAKLMEYVAQHLDLTGHLLLEPSAGDGSFYDLMRHGSIGIDIVSRHPGVANADFLATEITSRWPIAVIGNPPFGTGGSLAKRFFKHAATFADVIAMVFPASFQKVSVQNQLPLNFELLQEQLLPRNAFLLQGKSYDVSTIFQIWKRVEVLRNRVSTRTVHTDFAFVKPSKGTFGIRRNGGLAGLIHDDLGANPKSNYFIHPVHSGVRTIMASLDLANVAAQVTGAKSLAKSEIVALYDDFIRQRSTS